MKLEDASTGKNIMTVYVRGGMTEEVKVPIGRLKMKYATGTDWYGPEKLFGRSTS